MDFSSTEKINGGIVRAPGQHQNVPRGDEDGDSNQNVIDRGTARGVDRIAEGGDGSISNVSGGVTGSLISFFCERSSTSSNDPLLRVTLKEPAMDLPNTQVQSRPRQRDMTHLTIARKDDHLPPKLRIDCLRSDLIRQEDSIIFSFIERAQYAMNTRAYASSLSQHQHLLQYHSRNRSTHNRFHRKQSCKSRTFDTRPIDTPPDGERCEHTSQRGIGNEAAGENPNSMAKDDGDDRLRSKGADLRRRTSPITDLSALPRGLSMLEYHLLQMEKLHCELRRYMCEEEHAFFPNCLSSPILPLRPNRGVLRPTAINENFRIYNYYVKHIIAGLCGNKEKESLRSDLSLSRGKTQRFGLETDDRDMRDFDDSSSLSDFVDENDDGEYGSSSNCDIVALQALSKRIHYGKFVAESKYQMQQEKYDKLIIENDERGIWELLTNVEVEKRLLQRVRMKALIFANDIEMALKAAAEVTQDNTSARTDQNENPGGREEVSVELKVDPEFIVEVYRDFIIPMTKEVEVKYLLARRGPPVVACLGPAFSLSHSAAIRYFGEGNSVSLSSPASSLLELDPLSPPFMSTSGSSSQLSSVSGEFSLLSNMPSQSAQSSAPVFLHLDSRKRVLTEVSSGRATYGLLPCEAFDEGWDQETFKAIASSADMKVVAEVYVPQKLAIGLNKCAAELMGCKNGSRTEWNGSISCETTDRSKIHGGTEHERESQKGPSFGGGLIDLYGTRQNLEHFRSFMPLEAVKFFFCVTSTEKEAIEAVRGRESMMESMRTKEQEEQDSTLSSTVLDSTTKSYSPSFPQAARLLSPTSSGDLSVVCDFSGRGVHVCGFGSDRARRLSPAAAVVSLEQNILSAGLSYTLSWSRTSSPSDMDLSDLIASCSSDLPVSSSSDLTVSSSARKTQTNECGTHIDDHGTHINDHSTHVNDDGTHVNDHGTHVNDHGTHVNDHGTHVNDHGTHVNDHGTHVKDYGTRINEHRTHINEYGTSTGQMNEDEGAVLPCVSARCLVIRCGSDSADEATIDEVSFAESRRVTEGNAVRPVVSIDDDGDRWLDGGSTKKAPKNVLSAVPSWRDKTLLSLIIDDRSGALNDVLATLRDCRVNISCLFSYPLRFQSVIDKLFVIALEVQGHINERSNRGERDPSKAPYLKSGVAEAVRRIKQNRTARSVKVLGSYPDASNQTRMRPS